MNPIARFERVCARVVEGTFARIFPSALDPVHVGRKLIAAQAATSTDTFLVRVHPVDYARFAGDRGFLEARWAAMLRETMDAGAAPRAILHEDPTVTAGAVTIEAIPDEAAVESHRTDLSIVGPDAEPVRVRAGLRIGRSDDNDVVVRDARASRRHAHVVADGDGFALEDLESANGTFVNGAAVRRARLSAGAKITVGETVLDVR